MSDLLRIKRGLKANLPELMQGEFGYCTDTEELYIGGVNGNVQIGNQLANQLLSQHTTLTLANGVHGISTTANKTYYVNVATGNDNNDGLTSGTAFKTITKAISVIPQVINHNVTINVAVGTYPEHIVVEGLVGAGNLKIIGSLGAITDNYIVNSVYVSRCSARVEVQGFKAISKGIKDVGVNASFTQYSTINTYFSYCKTDFADNTIFGFYCACNTGGIVSCISSNKLHGIGVGTSGNLYSENNTGSGNTNGLTCFNNASIGKGGTQPTGITAEYTYNGGVIR